MEKVGFVARTDSHEDRILNDTSTIAGLRTAADYAAARRLNVEKTRELSNPREYIMQKKAAEIAAEILRAEAETEARKARSRSWIGPTAVIEQLTPHPCTGAGGQTAREAHGRRGGSEGRAGRSTIEETD